MPELTGVPILDTFIYLAALFAVAAPFAVAVLKFFDILSARFRKKPEPEPQFGRRAEDVAELKTRVGIVEVQVQNTDEKLEAVDRKVDGAVATIETHRTEARGNFGTVFGKLDRLSDQQSAQSTALVTALGELTTTVRRHGNGSPKPEPDPEPDEG